MLFFSAVRSVCRVLLAISVGAVAASCIKDDTGDCADPDEFQLYVKVVDTETGKDITQSGNLGEVLLAMFDSRGRFITTYLLNRDDIIGRKPLTLTDFDVEGMQISVWGDIGGDVSQSDPQKQSVSSDFLTLTVDDEGYSGSPDDFFFGFKTISTATRSIRREEVVITQKNSKLNITVRGLEQYDEEKYYFVIESPRSGYNFTGNPNNKSCRVRHKGKFSGKELVSPHPYLMIHSADAGIAGQDDLVTVSVFHKADEGDILLASACTDKEGNNIRLLSGKTTNVLIDISNGLLEVHVELTDWRQVYQWPVW